MGDNPLTDMPITPNALFCADCIDMMQRVEDQSIDLIYLDPPLFAKGSNGTLAAEKNSDVWLSKQLQLISKACQQSARILKQTGVLYFHTQPSSAFSIKFILNQILGEENFQEEIVWQYQQRLAVRARPGDGHDVILCYGKSLKSTNNRVFRPLNRDEARKFSRSDERGPYALIDLTAPVERAQLRFEWRGITPPIGRSWRFNIETLHKLDQEGRIYSPTKLSIPKLKSFLSEKAGVDAGTIWTDILPLSLKSSEAVRYPLQRPLGLLERLLHKGSHEGEVVLDPFCGSGTTLLAAGRYQRKWIACDTSEEAIEISRSRLMNERSDSNFATGDAKTLRPVPIKSARFKRVALRLDDIARIQFEYVLNHTVHVEETRHFEFKEIRSREGAISSIVNTSDEYAVAFLNSEGGTIIWGIRNSDRVVVGVPLNYAQRDQVRREVHAKLGSIEPRVDPSRYRLEIHDICDEHGTPVPNVCIVELIIPASKSADPYYTGGGEVWVRVDGSKKKVKGPALTDFIKHRLSHSDDRA